MPLPQKNDWFITLTRIVYWLAMVSLGALGVAVFAWMFLGHSTSPGVWETPEWVVILAKYSAYTLGATLLGLFMVKPVATMYYTVKAGEGWTFWRLTAKNALIAADPGTYWFADKDGLVALRPTMGLYNQFIVGDLIHRFVYTVQFKGGQITRDAAVAFYNWWQALPSHRKDASAMQAYLAQAEEGADLPFTVSVNRGTAPALAT